MTPPLVTIRDQRFEPGSTVELDGHWFVRCRFEQCVLVFRGVERFGLEGCTFIDPQFVAADVARMVLAQVGGLLDDATLLAVVRALLPDVSGPDIKH